MDVMKHDPANPNGKIATASPLQRPLLPDPLRRDGRVRYTPKDQLNTLRKLGSIYQGHPMCDSFPRSKRPPDLSAKACRSASAWRSREAR